MRLSRLHIAGFKSFPDRAELGFDDGVTAIVGPNGCGKSNVVDAITWVLGEQSARSLRGERMEDVIFNGSDARKPTATAEVRLKLADVAQAVLHGGDGPEAPPGPLVTRNVEIGRRLYRSGESEYLIDGEVCRLRDVHDLLMDSGLGVKAYAVIEQGKIGQILSSRPAERRMLIEEAAGVTKYKSRRRSAELKLEAAQQNLTRVDDIIFEVEKQRGALRRQAARAQRYKKLREELRAWERVQIARRHEALSRELASVEARLADGRAREAAAAAHVAELEAAIESMRLGLAEAEAASTASRERAHALELEIGRGQQQIQFDRQQMQDLARQAEAMAAEVEALSARRGPAAETRQAQAEAARDARERLGEAGRRVAAREADYREALDAVQGVEREADATRAAVLSAATTLAALRQSRDHAAAARDRVSAELARLEIEARELAADVDRASAQHAEATAALADLRAALDALGARRQSAEADLATRRADRETAARTLGERQRALAGDEARLRSLQQLDASRATFGDAARLLLADAASGIGQRGALADHLVVERSYERAVEALAGDLLQHVLVDRLDDVTAALARLAERDAGRCGFVVLEDAAGAPPDAPLVVPPGARALADVVRAVGPHAAVVGRLLGRALVVDSVDEARAIAATASVPVVTRQGEVFRGYGRVEGGSRRDARGILETRAEVEALSERVTAGTGEVAALSATLADLDAAIAAGASALAAMAAEQHEHEKRLVALEAQATRAADDRLRVSRRLEVVATERARAEDERAAAAARGDEAAAAIELHDAQQREAQAGLDQVSARLQAAREDAEARLRLVTESRTEQATLVERAAALDTEVARLDEAARELEARIAARTAEIQRTETRRTELSASLVETEHRLDENIAALDALKVEIRDRDEHVGTLRVEFTARDQEIRTARHDHDAARAVVAELDVTLARANADLAHLRETAVEAVGAPLDEVVAAVAALDASGGLTPPRMRGGAGTAADVESDEEDAESAESSESAVSAAAVGEAADEVAAAEAPGESAGEAPAETVTPAAAAGPAATPDEVIAWLRGRIDRLGPVNMMAIEQFDELETRHAFLTTQRQDLLDSIAQTGEAIRKIDKTTRERFAEAFEVINGHFEQTFTTLFGGGRAGLTLIDQENEAESGIDIIAQPPGKRLQNVQLLSGGEKALTAMALMFAIFKYRPSPFCLLDEIDAPLDDANIGRFIEMLEGMQAHTQFILITHNRKTMEIARRLYGVTMEEPGVSKLISLQLN